ncbi:hypothetical protein ACWD5Z_28240 [Micromonospora chokoriensis]
MPYLETSEDNFAQAASAFLGETTADGTVVLSGPCPRCGHAMEYLITTSVVKGWRARKAPAPTVAQPVEEMCCTCEQDHPGRPVDYLGCGAFWDLPLDS